MDSYKKMFDYHESLLESGHLSDVVLIVGGKEFRAHKVILSARSPVFAAMFAHASTKEAQENRVEIVDVDVEVMKLLVRYIYTGKVGQLELYAADLLAAADKYQLDGLKSICEQQLLSHAMTVNSVSDLFILADIYQSRQLYNKCLDYILDNCTEVVASKGWLQIVVRADLVAKLYEHLYSKYSKLIKVNVFKKKAESKGEKEVGNRIDWTPYASKLLVACDKYQLDSLKAICVQQLLSEVITTESVSELLIFADMHQITELTTKCLKYIACNGTQVIASKGWLTVVIKTDLLAKICDELDWNFAEQLLLCPISTETVLDLFILSDMHCATGLYTRCLDYITDNGTEVMATEGWKKILERADYLDMLFEHLSMKYSKEMDNMPFSYDFDFGDGCDYDDNYDDPISFPFPFRLLFSIMNNFN